MTTESDFLPESDFLRPFRFDEQQPAPYTRPDGITIEPGTWVLWPHDIARFMGIYQHEGRQCAWLAHMRLRPEFCTAATDPAEARPANEIVYSVDVLDGVTIAEPPSNVVQFPGRRSTPAAVTFPDTRKCRQCGCDPYGCSRDIHVSDDGQLCEIEPSGLCTVCAERTPPGAA